MSMPLLVADSGPLIALARLNLLHLPSRYFDATFVTTVVWDEVTRNPRLNELDRLQDAVASGWIKTIDDVVSPPDSLQREDVDVGEKMAIALALALPATLLIDDRRARIVAESLGVSAFGTIGLLVRAKRDALIPSLAPFLSLLRQSGYYLSARLIAGALSEGGE